MAPSARTLLALYLAAMFATLPFLREIVTFVIERLGWGYVSYPLHTVLALCVLLPVMRLIRPPRPALPWPHLAYLGLLTAALLALRLLASSPVGRIHLVEYALLAVLILRTIPLPRKGPHYAFALAAAAAVGVLDEVVQYFLPDRVFDSYDIALNAAAAALGVLTAAWWSWTERA
jgi:hypothetical protein